jgi:hypothetical protein
VRKTFVLIPGAGGRAWYWHLVVARLNELGHEGLAVDLPSADDGAGLPEYAGAVVNAIGERDPDNIVVVAQSLAGFVAPIVCGQLGISALVLVNAMIPVAGETPGEWWRNVRHREAKRQKNLRDGRQADAPFDPLVDFFHDVPQPIIDEAWEQGEPRQSETVFGSQCNFSQWPRNTHVLVSRDDRFFPVEFQRRVASERLNVEPDEMPGGHLVALSQPVELASRLNKYALTP